LNQNQKTIENNTTSRKMVVARQMSDVVVFALGGCIK
jgi:hypothetical protein